MSYNRFWSVSELSKVVDIEINHFDPEGDEMCLEAYDIRMRVPNEHNFCFDLPPELAKKLYEKLKEVFES